VDWGWFLVDWCGCWVGWLFFLVHSSSDIGINVARMEFITQTEGLNVSYTCVTCAFCLRLVPVSWRCRPCRRRDRRRGVVVLRKLFLLVGHGTRLVLPDLPLVACIQVMLPNDAVSRGMTMTMISENIPRRIIGFLNIASIRNPVRCCR